MNEQQRALRQNAEDHLRDIRNMIKVCEEQIFNTTTDLRVLREREANAAQCLLNFPPKEGD